MDTAEFVKNMNDLFDCMNSKILNDRNKFRCAWSTKCNVICGNISGNVFKVICRMVIEMVCI